MCSIGGWIAAKEIDPAVAHKLTAGLIFYGQIRGKQSAGVWSNGHTIKRAMEPEKLINIRAFRELMAKPTKLVLTHTRMPTCGGLGDQQAQPFTLGDTTTVHNGHVSNIKEMIQKHGLTKASGVDSELFTSFVQEKGLMELPTFMQDMHGSAALAIVREGQELYFCRDHNPTEFYCTKVDGIPVLIFGSTQTQVLDAMKSQWFIPPGVYTKSTDSYTLLRAEPTGVTSIAEVKRYVQIYTPEKGSTYSGVQGRMGFTGHGWPDPDEEKEQRPRVKARWDRNLKCMVDPRTGRPLVNGD